MRGIIQLHKLQGQFQSKNVGKKDYFRFVHYDTISLPLGVMKNGCYGQTILIINNQASSSKCKIALSTAADFSIKLRMKTNAIILTLSVLQN